MIRANLDASLNQLQAEGIIVCLPSEWIPSPNTAHQRIPQFEKILTVDMMGSRGNVKVRHHCTRSAPFFGAMGCEPIRGQIPQFDTVFQDLVYSVLDGTRQLTAPPAQPSVTPPPMVENPPSHGSDVAPTQSTQREPNIASGPSDSGSTAAYPGLQSPEYWPYEDPDLSEPAGLVYDGYLSDADSHTGPPTVRSTQEVIDLTCDSPPASDPFRDASSPPTTGNAENPIELSDDTTTSNFSAHATVQLSIRNIAWNELLGQPSAD